MRFKMSTTSWLFWISFIAIWGHLLNQLWPDWSSYPQYSYGWVVPLLGAYLVWKRWTDRPEPEPPGRPKSFAFGLYAIGLALLLTRIVQSPNREWRVVSWALACEATALTLLWIWHAGGAAWVRHFAFPALFIFTAVPWPHLQENALTQMLMEKVAGITVEILGVTGIVAAQTGNLIEIGNGVVGIDEACSGIRSLQSTLMSSIFLGELYRLGVLRRCLLVLVGLICAFLLNLTRTYFLAWIANRDGLSAVQKFHDQAGLSILFICVLAVWGLAAWISRANAPASQPQPPPRPKETHQGNLPLPVWAPMLALAWIFMIEASVEIWFRMRSSGLMPNAVWRVQWPEKSHGYERIKLSDAIRSQISYDEGGAAVWFEPDGSRWTMYFFRWNPGSITSRILARSHRPEVCLPAGGFKLREDHGVKNIAAAGLELPFRAFTFESEGRLLQVFFCLWEDMVPGDEQFVLSGRTPSSGRLKAVFEGRRDSLGQQTIEFIAAGYPDIAQAEASLRSMLGKIIQNVPGSLSRPEAQ